MNITVSRRPKQTKGERKRRIRQGFIPGAVYGRNIEPFLVEVPAKAIAEALLSESGLNTVVELTVEGDSKKHQVQIDDLVRHSITRSFVHIGLHEIKRGEKVTAHIPIRLIGIPESVASKTANLSQNLDTVEVHALPADLPSHLDVDVSKLNVGDVIHVSDLQHSSKLEFGVSGDTAIAAVHYTRAAEAESGPSDGAAAA